jgi:hypothetical protein
VGPSFVCWWWPCRSLYEHSHTRHHVPPSVTSSMPSQVLKNRPVLSWCSDDEDEAGMARGLLLDRPGRQHPSARALERSSLASSLKQDD